VIIYGESIESESENVRTIDLREYESKSVREVESGVEVGFEEESERAVDEESGPKGVQADRPTGREDMMGHAEDIDPAEPVDAEVAGDGKEATDHTTSAVAASGAVFIMVSMIMIIVYARVRRRY